VRHAGSQKPLTYDCVMITAEFAPTTDVPCMYCLDNQILQPISDKLFLFKRGEWLYEAIPPKISPRRPLEEWEKVVTVAARFTMPFER